MGKLSVVDVICNSLDKEPSSWKAIDTTLTHRDGLSLWLWDAFDIKIHASNIELSFLDKIRIYRSYKKWQRNPRSCQKIMKLHLTCPELSYDDLLEEVKYLANASPEHALISKHAYIRNLVK
jgi:hypothetical protein